MTPDTYASVRANAAPPTAGGYLRRIGAESWAEYLRFAVITGILAGRRGLSGIGLRRLAYRAILAKADRAVILEDVVIRGAGRIALDRDVMIEHRVTLDAKSAHAQAIVIGERSMVRTGTVLDTGYTGWIRVGSDVAIGPRCELRGVGGLTIGDGALLAGGCFLASGTHHLDRPDVRITDQGVSPAPIVIGPGAWIGANAFIGAGVTIGANAVVGANAAVTRDVPAAAIVAGVPARVLRLRPGFGQEVPA